MLSFSVGVYEIRGRYNCLHTRLRPTTQGDEIQRPTSLEISLQGLKEHEEKSKDNNSVTQTLAMTSISCLTSYSGDREKRLRLSKGGYNGPAVAIFEALKASPFRIQLTTLTIILMQ